MQKPPGIEYFDNLEDAINEAIETLRFSITEGSPAIAEELQDLIAIFEKRGVFIKQTSANVRLLNEISRKIDTILDKSVLPLSTKELLKELPANAELVNGYFAATFKEFSLSKPIYKAVTDFYVQYTADAMIGQGVNQQFKQGIVDILRQGVKNGISTTEAKKQILKYVVEDDKLAKQASQVASDALHQYNAEYTEVLTHDLGLSHYYYKGTKIDTTRQFCASRVGKYFTEKEVEGWASLKWDGKIPGTTAKNIKMLRGGYNCRHLLVPVSEEVYKARVGATKPV